MTPSEIPYLPLVFGLQNEENCLTKIGYKYCAFIIMALTASDNAPIVLAPPTPGNALKAPLVTI